ncbi:MAG TPA: LysE family transporter [Panacibacter sp.]|nr:LysE family transporter [Panacibacter sp.]HNP45606.1 LysE family transporter [Panacibacter sp.]
MNSILIFLKGWLVSFLGQLPLGTMSITSTQIAVQESFRNAWKYSLGVAIVEIIYLRFTLTGVDWIIQHSILFIILGWVTAILFLILGIFSFLTAYKQQAEKKAVLLENNISRFFLGLSMSALNPAQIPFWFIWSSYLINNGSLPIDSVSFNIFTLGCGTGTIAGLALYMYGGNWIIRRMNTGNRILNIIMGCVFIIAAIAQFYRMIWGNII